MDQWDALMETTVLLAATSSNPIEDHYKSLLACSSLYETHLGMKENDFLPGVIHLPSKMKMIVEFLQQLGTFLDILLFSPLICLTIAFKAGQIIHILSA